MAVLSVRARGFFQAPQWRTRACFVNIRFLSPVILPSPVTPILAGPPRGNRLKPKWQNLQPRQEVNLFVLSVASSHSTPWWRTVDICSACGERILAFNWQRLTQRSYYSCINQTITNQRRCPICRAPVSRAQLRQIRPSFVASDQDHTQQGHADVT